MTAAVGMQTVEINRKSRNVAVDVEWVDDWPPEVLAAVQPFEEMIIGMLPRWIHRLYIRWDAADGDNVASTRAMSRNRWATMHICPQFLNDSEDERRVTLLHEVAHIYFDRMGDAFRQAVKQLGDDGARKIANQWFYDAEEEAVSDLAEVFATCITMRQSRDG